ncbi:MAG: peptidoglycan-binding protein [Rubrivivax sp.]
MITHTVVAGDCVSSIAALYGLFADTVWNHPANAALRALRQDPNVLAPGDQVVIPDKQLKRHKLATGARHKFTLIGVPVLLRLQLVWGDEARANEPFVATVDGAEQRGHTGGDGTLELKVKPGAREGRLVVGEGARRSEYRLDLGTLDPVETTAGVIERLRNLGYDTGAPRGAWDDAARGALMAFQADHGLESSGEPDAATQARLRDLHDGA